jgi:transcriptional regulator with XRE-family HTH domain
MDFARLGRIFRALRIRKRWRQQDLAVRAGVTRAAVSRLERGHGRELRVDELLAIAEALDVTLKLYASWRGGELDRLLNARHSQLHESVGRWLLELPGWEFAPEVSFSIHGERGIIDILAWHAASRTLLVIELKTEIVDINELMGRVDVKGRLAVEIGRQRGWHARNVAVWVVVAEGSTNRRRVATHSTTLRAAFPTAGRDVEKWLANPEAPIKALSFWSNARRGSVKDGLATVKRVRASPTRAA